LDDDWRRQLNSGGFRIDLTIAYRLLLIGTDEENCPGDHQ
jgi:hypothetical protein